jgi:hypothetical protein
MPPGPQCPFYPASGHLAVVPACPFCANSGRMHRNKMDHLVGAGEQRRASRLRIATGKLRTDRSGGWIRQF